MHGSCACAMTLPAHACGPPPPPTLAPACERLSEIAAPPPTPAPPRRVHSSAIAESCRRSCQVDRMSPRPRAHPIPESPAMLPETSVITNITQAVALYNRGKTLAHAMHALAPGVVCAVRTTGATLQPDRFMAIRGSAMLRIQRIEASPGRQGGTTTRSPRGHPATGVLPRGRCVDIPTPRPSGIPTSIDDSSMSVRCRGAGGPAHSVPTRRGR
jgi:hypothetical protein